MAKAKSKWAPIVFIFISLAVLGYLAGQFFKDSSDKITTPDYQERMNEIKEKDLSTLNDLSLDDQKIYGALLRRGQALDPKAKAMALDLINSERGRLKEAAYQALGYFSGEEVLSILLNGLQKEENARVKRAIIRGLSFKQEPQRREALSKLINESALEEANMALVLEGLIKTAPNEKERDQASHQLLKLFDKSESLAVKNDVLLRLNSVHPSFPPLSATMEKILKDPKEKELHPLAIRQLASQQNQWLKDNLGSFLKSEMAPIRLAAMDTLPSLCPSERWELLRNSLFEEKDRRIRASLNRAFAALGGQNMQVLLNQALSEPSFNEEEKKEFQALLNDESINSQISDTCELRSKD